MPKYKITKQQQLKIEACKNPIDLRNELKSQFPDAFINWYEEVCKRGDILTKDGGRYMVISDSNGFCMFLNLKSGITWANKSTVTVGKFNSVSRMAFMQITKGIPFEKFKKEK